VGLNELARVGNYLEFYRDVVDVTTIFIVVTSILPDECHSVLKLVPAFEEGKACGLFTSNNSLHFLLHGRQRHRFFDQRVVVL
jgi:hypothetical protein